ncbi:hypothetical protein FPANT_10197 [Fusarium pseudoanthophilum]|uniref:Uncharacterized protein n=1 Tax=Fusarium pseudoanthophilum TaxID=48495 RepID=A0A8H5NSV7_9HYPO|nr:hypothetical protein FPANT_10197 [Fusarium pseudoanthophilum]
MKLVPALLLLPLHSALALQGVHQQSDPQLVHLTFHGGLASYSMAFPADGSTRKTDHNLSVDVIDNSDYNALEQCFFAIKGQAKLTPKVSPKDGSQHILVNPSRVITAVNCTGSCVPTYGKYTRSNSRDPAYLTKMNGRRVL